MEFNKIYNQDCLQGIQEIPDNAVDLIVCDPPYGTIKGIGKNTDFSTLRTEWDTVIQTDKLFAEFGRVLRPNGTIVLFSADPYTSHLRMFKGGDNLVFAYPMIWKKPCTGNPLKARIAPLSFFEDVSVWKKRVQETSMEHPLRNYARALCEWLNKSAYDIIRELAAKGYEQPTRVQHFLAWNGQQFHVCTAETYEILKAEYCIEKFSGFLPFDELTKRDREFMQTQGIRGAVFNIPNGQSCVSNVLECARDLNTFHPTQKQLSLIQYLIDVFSEEGDLVLDACMGSGTTAVACIKEKRRFVGFELDAEFYAKACARIAEAQRTPTLF